MKHPYLWAAPLAALLLAGGARADLAVSSNDGKAVLINGGEHRSR